MIVCIFNVKRVLKEQPRLNFLGEDLNMFSINRGSQGGGGAPWRASAVVIGLKCKGTAASVWIYRHGGALWTHAKCKLTNMGKMLSLGFDSNINYRTPCISLVLHSLSANPRTVARKVG